ncbi:pseudouridine synthase [Tractidigestivibacter sp.]|uniref:pseudouridine synthase n=1 Tax=Tractidigestivibacter sp. TaxID=2847320 RepID=UPI002A90C779|nr:pseudouridine synthase [Tractidigestivibacter sp.]MCI6274544.1 rRNA pseudouridine synthase [Coriobacteriaceae bacterium]MDY5272417.1 pseudouridine synthase [Tractidigestivibacter sp.]
MSDPLREDGLYPMRLQRYLARAGVASRRGAERLMSAGRVRVNGEVVCELGSKVDPATDVVSVDGVECHVPERPRYLMLYKPAGFVTTMSDPQGRPTVAQLVPTNRYPGLFPVGRLDMDTTGLLLFTTNGSVGQGLLHPSRHVEKHYVALVSGTPSAHDLARLRRGVMLEDGPASPAAVALLGRESPLYSVVAPRGGGRTGAGEPNAVVGLTIHEGRKHQVKKMMQAVGHKVLRLHRDAFGPLSLTGVGEGRWRELSAREVAAIEATCAGGTGAEGGDD